MAVISFSIPNTEIIVVSGYSEATCQEIHDACREFEDEFQMMGLDHIVDAGGKLPIDVAQGIYTEIVLSIRYPWTLRFEDENTAHCKVSGGTLLAFDQFGDPRPVSTNYGLTISQSISGTLVETGVSGLTPTESAQLANASTNTDTLITLMNRALGLMNENTYIDNTVFNGPGGELTAMRIRCYDSKANADAHGATGLVATYLVEAVYLAVGQVQTYKMTLQP